LIPVGKKTIGGDEILQEVSTFLQRKVSEELPEPPATLNTPEAERATIKEMVALAASCSQSIGRETVDEPDGNSSQTLFSYKKAEIQEISLKIEKPALEDALFDYVRKCKGQIDLERCSLDLESSNEDIKKALKNLGAKGKIKIEVKSET
jgi:hypothetical protein